MAHGDDLLQSHRAIDDVMKRPEQLPPAPPRPGVRAADWRGSVSRLKTEAQRLKAGRPGVPQKARSCLLAL